MNHLKELFDLSGKVAIVTGGLGMLGSEYTQTLVRAGAKVAIFDKQQMVSGHALSSLIESGAVLNIKVDITKRKEVESALASVIDTFGLPQILINNAAIDFPPINGGGENFENYPIEKWNDTLAVNLTGMFICCQVVGAKMAENNDGSIINISSIYGLLSPDQRIYKDFVKPAAYSVTKSGVLNLTRYLATYWASKNVRVNTLTLGGVGSGQDQEFINKYSDKTPLGRMAKKDDYNGAILFLSSNASSYMTGSNLVIDGGWSAW
ncbi:MAG: short-chain dehydrogenase [Candidatus Buchananbacteria bacterium CG10_big_fil_rev_8_21_14_0_10_42_9]|uniref:Short-chain dehydrogenase n=1 Tax=Candidatus Buchananbacteria bacterium CG10_big_fil_rev_8_21_14_0_10_42_9 TaxID=1974526 RepID=A0A2H0W1Q9_9BACT|nr:MAG: short-chain dehydrogenase [Candidatus Buchananbacteria bacterium CG10_big_fil_rev_8_21_14_0_10_42_9]